MRAIIYVIEPRPVVLESALGAGHAVIPVLGPGAHADAPHVVRVDDATDVLGVARALLADGVTPGDPSTTCLGLGDIPAEVGVAVSAILHLDGIPRPDFAALERLLDKEALRDLLGGGHRLNVAHRRIHSTEELREFSQHLAGGVVVKPISGSGSRGVRVMNRSEALIAVVNSCEAPLLAEERIVGQEFSVEMLSWNGRHVRLAVTQKSTGGLTGVVETGHVQPAPIPPSATGTLFDAAQTVLDAVGYMNGLSHSEFILTSDGRPKLVEAHGRVGGDRIADMLTWTVGASAFDLLFQAIRDGHVPGIHPTGRRAGVRFFDLHALAVTDAEWSAAIRAIPGTREVTILRQPGDRPPFVSSSDRHALAVFAGEPDDVDRAIERAITLTEENSFPT